MPLAQSGTPQIVSVKIFSCRVSQVDKWSATTELCWWATHHSVEKTGEIGGIFVAKIKGYLVDALLAIEQKPSGFPAHSFENQSLRRLIGKTSAQLGKP